MRETGGIYVKFTIKKLYQEIFLSSAFIIRQYTYVYLLKYLKINHKVLWKDKFKTKHFFFLN